MNKIQKTLLAEIERQAQIKKLEQEYDRVLAENNGEYSERSNEISNELFLLRIKK